MFKRNHHRKNVRRTIRIIRNYYTAQPQVRRFNSPKRAK